jgi:hypothetical protein
MTPEQRRALASVEAAFPDARFDVYSAPWGEAVFMHRADTETPVELNPAKLAAGLEAFYENAVDAEDLDGAGLDAFLSEAGK